MTTKTQRSRIARYERLLTTLQKTETLLVEMEIPDAGTAIERNRQIQTTVKAQLELIRTNA